MDAVGLCGACRHARPITNRRGSRFLLCGRSKSDPGFARYPRLPVLRCSGFEPDAGTASPTEPGTVEPKHSTHRGAE